MIHKAFLEGNEELLKLMSALKMKNEIPKNNERIWQHKCVEIGHKLMNHDLISEYERTLSHYGAVRS